jgi:hypothetical protein
MRPTRVARLLSAIAAVAIVNAVAGAGAARAGPDAQRDGKLDARCTYVEHPGTCTIVSIEKTQDSIAQASLDGGPGYEGLAVTFTYAGAAANDDGLAHQALEGKHELRLTNSWYPGPRFLERYGIAAGKSFACTLHVISQGTCTPTVFDFQGIERADYFESEH